jgi:hypothetical protein
MIIDSSCGAASTTAPQPSPPPPHGNTRQPHDNPPPAVGKLGLMEQPAPFRQRLPRSLRPGVDQTAHDIVTAHEVGVCQHLEQILSMPFLPFRTLLMPHSLLEFFPVPFVFRINDDKRVTDGSTLRDFVEIATDPFQGRTEFPLMSVACRLELTQDQGPNLRMLGGGLARIRGNSGPSLKGSRPRKDPGVGGLLSELRGRSEAARSRARCPACSHPPRQSRGRNRAAPDHPRSGHAVPEP